MSTSATSKEYRASNGIFFRVEGEGEPLLSGHAWCGQSEDRTLMGRSKTASLGAIRRRVPPKPLGLGGA